MHFLRYFQLRLLRRRLLLLLLLMNCSGLLFGLFTLGDETFRQLVGVFLHDIVNIRLDEVSRAVSLSFHFFLSPFDLLDRIGNILENESSKSIHFFLPFVLGFEVILLIVLFTGPAPYKVCDISTDLTIERLAQEPRDPHSLIRRRGEAVRTVAGG